MMIYPSDYIPPVVEEISPITQAQKTWLKNQLDDYMDENRGYPVNELFKHIKTLLANIGKWFPPSVIKAEIIEYGELHGYQPVVSEEPV